MRLGVAWLHTAAAYYRAIEPLQAMERRGHQVVWPAGPDGTLDLRRLAGCDVVHVYRRCDDPSRQILAELKRQGTAVTYDNDDDLTAVPKESPNFRELGGLEGQRSFVRSVKAARLADVVTVTSEVLAEKYRRAGVERVEVIGNHPGPGFSARAVEAGGEVTIGWVAGGEHMADVKRLKIGRVLRQVLEANDHVNVVTVGINLGLPGRYRHVEAMHLHKLPAHIAGFDIGLAPLADIAINRARSDIKLKEYAACGVPWLASPVGPYVGLGEEQGGRLVADDDWAGAIQRLVDDRAARRQLAANAAAWAQSNTIDAVAARWEAVFAEAAGMAPGPVTAVAPPPRPAVSLQVSGGRPRFTIR